MHWVGGSVMYEGECQGFEPSGARLGSGGDVHVVGALPKMHLQGQARWNGNSVGFIPYTKSQQTVGIHVPW